MKKIGLDDFFLKIPAFKRETYLGCQRIPLDDPTFKPFASWYQKWEKRQRDGGEKGFVKELADELLQTECFAKDAGGRLYHYERGVYRAGGVAVVSARVKQLLVLNHDERRWSTHRAAEVAAWIAVDAPILWERAPLDTLNLANGLLHLGTQTLSPHSPDHRSAVQLPLIYNLTATCDEWDSFIGDGSPTIAERSPMKLLRGCFARMRPYRKRFFCEGMDKTGKARISRQL